MIYWARCILKFLLINKSNLFTKKKMFDEIIILAYFRYFLDYLQLFLIRARDAKIAESDLAVSFIKVIFAGNIFVL